MADTKGYIRISDDKGSVNIGQNVVATIAAAAAVDVDGVYGLYQSSDKEITDIAGIKKISKGAKVTLEEDGILVDMSVIAEVGSNVSEVASMVQRSVKSAVEGSVGGKVKTVNVSINGVSLKKKKPAAAAPHNVEARPAARP